MGSVATYSFNSGAVVPTNRMRYIDIFNDVGSGKIIKVHLIKGYTKPSLAHAANCVYLTILKTSTVATGGTTLSAVQFDSTDPALPSQITSRGSPTAGGTSLYNLGGFNLGLDDNLFVAPCIAYNNRGGKQPRQIILREGEGLMMQQINFSTGSVGVGVVEVEFGVI